MTQGNDHLANIPVALVVRAQEDMDFALRLLNREDRDGAIREAGLDLTDDQRSALDQSLDDIAALSFQEAIQVLRDFGVSRLV